MTAPAGPCAVSRALIVNYHYCRPTPENGRAPAGVLPEMFDRHMERIAAHFRPLAAGCLPLPAGDEGTGCLVTFDDGIRDVFEHALPVVARRRVASAVFCCSQPYVEKRVLNVQKTHLLQKSWGWEGFRVRFMAALDQDPEGSEREDVSALGLEPMYRYDAPETAAFKRLLNVELPYRVVNRVLDRLFDAEYGSQMEAVDHLYMSADELKRCADRGMGIGVHTHSHCMLSRLSDDEQNREISAPVEFFRDRLGLDVRLLSYPYGIAGAWNATTKAIARANGLSAALTLGRSLYDPRNDSDGFEIPRFDVNDVFNADGEIKLRV